MLRDGFYEIPRFQRPYSWSAQEVDDFLEDVIVQSGPDYFIGSMVVYSIGTESFAVVDGQQRLTTITLMLAALRDLAAQLGHAGTARGLQKLIEREDDNDKRRFILQPQTSYPFFQREIQRFSADGNGDGGDSGSPPKPTQPVGPEERALANGYIRIGDFVREAVEPILTDETIANDERAKRALARLEEIRDKVLGLRVIFVEVDNEDDAYFIFETMNTRGKDLTTADLVRNHLLARIPKANEGLDLARDQWNALLGLFQEAPTDADVNRFLLHQWLSLHPYTSDKKLFRALRKTVTTADQSQAYLDRLTSDATLYREATQPSAANWSKQERDVRDALSALELFGVRQPVPMVLSLLREKRAGGIKLAALKRALRAIENFYFVTTAIASVPSSGGVSSMFARHARELSAAADQQAKADVIKALTARLRTMKPNLEQFVAGFELLHWSRAYPLQRRLVHYVLRRVFQHEDNTPWDFDEMTVEHLRPQSHSGEPEQIANIGNLVLVSRTLNEKLGDKSFSKKLPILAAQKKVWVDPDVTAAKAWGKAQIEARAKRMAQLAYEQVWTY